MPDWFYQGGPYEIWAFVVVTVIIGGAAAFATGRAVADTWRPAWQAAAYMLPLAAAVRFVQFSVFNAKLMSPGSYAVDLLFLLLAATLGYRITRQHQMAEQYRWRTNK